uniref:Uncharacterized protein n=1 Tax=Timspurckia oligopyrenoides TaxID=708627 RepID=A0A7S0ZGX3_9RHOD|mmetsp:Transcript_4804/g.8381  ORF Transcript_4804/g.8381 Transcript_4804/m.8381 type:complete len:137 (+) Transcript_4804:3-413(+)
MIKVMGEKREDTVEEFSNEIKRSTKEGLKVFSSIEQLERHAVEHWAQRQQMDETPMRESLHQKTLERWVHNFVRHKVVNNYYRLLRARKGRIGTNEAYEAMKKEVRDEVTRFYKQKNAQNSSTNGINTTPTLTLDS